MSSKILDSNQINQKIKRLSYDIYENNLEEKKIILLGINANGNILSLRIKKYLDDLFSINVESYNLNIDHNTTGSNNLNFKQDQLNEKKTFNWK